MGNLSTTASFTDIELLELLCSEEDDEPYFKLFVERFLDELKNECLRICRSRKLDHHIGIQISHETFERVRKYKSFKQDGIKMPDKHAGILVYLNRIAIHLFNDYYKGEKKNSIPHKTYFEEIQEGIPEVNLATLKQTKEKALAIFKKLSEREKIVVLADIEHKKHQKYLSSDVTESLAARLGVQKDTIRKIRQRAIVKIKKELNEIYQN